MTIFPLVLILINQFEEWDEKKLQLLHMLEEIKATLVRKGIFEDIKDKEQTFEDAKEQARAGVDAVPQSNAPFGANFRKFLLFLHENNQSIL